LIPLARKLLPCHFQHLRLKGYKVVHVMFNLSGGPTFWCQKVGKPMTKAAQACFVMVFNFSAECDCNLNSLWFYGFGGLWPVDILVP